jgi:16S rRNA (guanine527-N7)-methyltransferase
MTVDMGKDSFSATGRLNSLLASACLDPLDPALGERFEDYLGLLMRWNARINLTAIRDEEGILTRHFVESIACARALPAGIGTLLDFGSGAGFPGVPIALCRPEIAVTLAESQGKKAAFLQEAVRVLGLATKVYAGRAELLKARFDCVVLRAVDRMPQAVRAASKLASPEGRVLVMATKGELEQFEGLCGQEFSRFEAYPLAGSATGVLAIAHRRINLPA